MSCQFDRVEVVIPRGERPSGGTNYSPVNEYWARFRFSDAWPEWRRWLEIDVRDLYVVLTELKSSQR